MTPMPSPAKTRAAPPPTLPGVLAFMQVLWAVTHRLEQTSKRMNSRLGVTGPQRLVLRVVGLYPGVSAGGLAAILHVHPSTLTGVLRRLQAQRMLVREGDPSDGRRALLRLSPAGVRANASRTGTVELAVERALAACDGSEMAAAIAVLERVATQLEHHDHPLDPAPTTPPKGPHATGMD